MPPQVDGHEDKRFGDNYPAHFFGASSMCSVVASAIERLAEGLRVERGRGRCDASEDRPSWLFSRL